MNLFQQTNSTLFDGVYELPSCIQLTQMNRTEYDNGGENLNINYGFSNSPLGDILMASTQKGLCWLSFYQDPIKALDDLKTQFPKADFNLSLDDFQKNALLFFNPPFQQTLPTLVLHLKAQDFQLKVWKALLNIPFGNLSTYKNIAQEINQPTASRAVGNAIGNNPIAYIIPCHRVILSSGKISGYRWGSAKKLALINWEK